MAACRRSSRSAEKPTDSGLTGVMSIAAAWTGAVAGCWARPENEPATKMSEIRAEAMGSDAGIFMGVLLGDGSVR